MIDFPHSERLFVLALVLSTVCAALTVLMVVRHARRRQRLSALLSEEGWHTATGADEEGWRWSGLLGDGVASAITVNPATRTVDLKVRSAPMIEGGWALVSSRLLRSGSRRRWQTGLPADLLDLLKTGTARPCSGIPGFWLVSAPDAPARPSHAILQEMARLPDNGPSWVAWACQTHRWVRRIGPRPHLAWPQVRRLGRALAGE